MNHSNFKGKMQISPSLGPAKRWIADASSAPHASFTGRSLDKAASLQLKPSRHLLPTTLFSLYPAHSPLGLITEMTSLRVKRAAHSLRSQGSWRTWRESPKLSTATCLLASLLRMDSCKRTHNHHQKKKKRKQEKVSGYVTAKDAHATCDI